MSYILEKDIVHRLNINSDLNEIVICKIKYAKINDVIRKINCFYTYSLNDLIKELERYISIYNYGYISNLFIENNSEPIRFFFTNNNKQETFIIPRFAFDNMNSTYNKHNIVIGFSIKNL